MESSTGAGEQSAYSIWIPRDAKRALCLAYGGQVSASVMRGLAEQVEVDPACLVAADCLDVVMLIGHPAAARSGKRERARADFQKTITNAWARLHSSGTLIVAYDPAGGRQAPVQRITAWAHLGNWLDVRAIDGTVRSLTRNRVTHLHVFPSVWRPVLLYSPESPAPVKRAALTHISGWRARMIRHALSGCLPSLTPLPPGGLVWIASR